MLSDEQTLFVCELYSLSNLPVETFEVGTYNLHIKLCI